MLTYSIIHTRDGKQVTAVQTTDRKLADFTYEVIWDKAAQELRAENHLIMTAAHSADGSSSIISEHTF